MRLQPKQRYKRWEITYRVPGYKQVFYESFNTYEEADVRCAEIELAKRTGTLRPPDPKHKSTFTVKDYLEEYIDRYGSTHWGDSQYSICCHQIRDYVNPSSFAKLLLRHVTTKDIDDFYLELLTTPAVVLKGHKDTGRTISYSVIEKLHRTLRAAFGQAVKWGYLTSNPAINANVPKIEHKPRPVWTPAQAQEAIMACKDSNLKMCLLLAVGCSLRVGEILGLQWDCVHLADGNKSTLEVKQELKRCDKEVLSVLSARGRSDVFFTFPETKANSKTVLVLKKPKTKSSVRTVYVPNTVASALKELKAQQEARKEELHGIYQDFNMVIAQSTGRPVEERFIAKAFRQLIEETNLPVVVFHSLRHLSTSVKLQLSGGDIKAVQGDTGHSQASMVTQVYSHTFDENRRRVADLMETSFFETETPEVDAKREQVLALLDARPELVDLLLAMR